MTPPMKVLSLFDGISCGRVALERAGIKVERYVAYEIDRYAIEVSSYNYPDIEHKGSVVGVDYTQYKDFDIVMGGFPCTDLSLAKANRQGLRGEHSSLFWEIARAIKEVKPKYFLVENNYGMPPEDYRVICEELGCEPIMINSALLSAQTRKRYYWTNIAEESYGLFGDKRCGVPQPEDKGLLLKDILLSGNVHNDKSYCLTSSYNGACFPHDDERSQRQLVAEPICINAKINGVQPSLQNRIYDIEGKAVAVTGSYRPNIIVQRGHVFNKGGVKEGKTPTLTATGSYQDNNHVITPTQVGNLYPNGSQGGRIYSSLAKSVSLTSNAGGAGAKTGLYAIPDDAYTYKTYEVCDGKIDINGKILKINLPNGTYSIRKLHPIECERLQTLPDNFTERGLNNKGGGITQISDAQRYKQLGNGWTVDVIAHILKYIKM